MLTFNTFRSDRYLRTKFVEGRFLLASEGTDLELEVVDLLRTNLKNSIGDVFVGSGLQPQYLNANQVLIHTGEAWYRGLPFFLRSSTDELFSSGALPPGVTLSSDALGRGVILSFSPGATPTNSYKIVLTANEQLITDIQDPFLKNANITESTAQKLRLNYLVNVVVASVQQASPIPYNSENDGYAFSNLVNDIVVFPMAGQNGELLSTVPVSGAAIDGRSAELTIRNNPSLGGGNPLPTTSLDQASYTNGKLLDSNGTEYHLNAIFLDPGNSNNVILRIDQEVNQALPVINNGSTFIVRKRDVYVQDDSTGNPVGKLFLPLGQIDWDSTNSISHPSHVIDQRNRIIEEDSFQDDVNVKVDLFATGGGSVGFNSSTQILTWTAPFTIQNPYGPNSTIATGSSLIMDGGSLAYEVNLFAGGAVGFGNQGVVISSTSGSMVGLSGSPSLANVRLGNVIQDSGGNVAYITAINDVTKVLTLNTPLLALGPATIYLDSFGPGVAPFFINTFILGVRNGNFIWSTFLPSSTNYTSNIRGTQGEPLNSRASILTDAVGDEQEDRSAYLRSDNPISWTGTTLTFTSDIILEVINTKSGVLTQHTIPFSTYSPLVLSNGESAWVSVNRTSTSETLVLNKSTVVPLPAQVQSTKDVFVIFRRVDVSGSGNLHIPLHKQVLLSGLSTIIGNSTIGSNFNVDTILTSFTTGQVLVNSNGNVLIA